MKIRCDIKGIDCPHCASKLESLLKKSFDDVTLNFTMESLVITSNEDENIVLEKARKIAESFEDGISIELRD